jgi:cardiolipin synthase
MLTPNNQLKTVTCSLFALISILLNACGSLPANLSSTPLTEPRMESGDYHSMIQGKVVSDKKPDNNATMARKITSMADGVALIAESAYIDPVLRPFSTTKAYYALMMKSVGGFIQRTTVDTIRFLLLKQTIVPAIVENASGMDLVAWERELDEITGTRTSSGTINFLVDGDEYFPRLNNAITNAQDSIDIRTYIFDSDDVAVKVADLLKQKSGDVEVKVLVDGLGDLFATTLDSETMPEDFQPPPSIANYLRAGSKVKVRKQSNPWLTGDHAKSTIVDKNLAFIGGMNIGREYRYDWHDLMVEVKGPVVNQIQYEFDKVWAKSSLLGDIALLGQFMKGYNRDLPMQGHPIRVLGTTSYNSQIYRAQLAAIRRAQSHIYIENAYFSDDNVLYELIRARRRGVDVRVIVASSSDNGTMNLSNELTINSMLQNGIRVYAYPGMTHVKAAVYDRWACFGSANFDKLSLQINQELNLATSDRETVNKLVDRVFRADFAASNELHEIIPVGWAHRVAEFISDEAL